MNSDQDAPIFIERIPRNMMESNFGNYWTRVVELWGERIGYAFFFYLFFEDLLLNAHGFPLVVLAIVLFVAILIFLSAEFQTATEVKSATPIRIHHDRLEVHRSAMDALRGINKRINREDIGTIKVRRGPIRQNKRPFRDYITWKNAPYELIITLRNGRRYRTGYKYPPQVDMIIRLLREQWAMEIIDSGTGVGEVYDRDTDFRLSIHDVIRDAYR